MACEICNQAPAKWRIERTGDAAVTWTCDTHLPQACDQLQRDFEVTALTVRNSHKMSEWAAISHTLDNIAGGD